MFFADLTCYNALSLTIAPFTGTK